ncbi:LCP family protein [Candidatus Saccharibacteria bacterium]|nr:LCP family protein [Candidatus Saccharibacteria bacterium]
MPKKIQSIDGFTLKRRDSVSTDGAGGRAFLDSKSAPKLDSNKTEVSLKKVETTNLEPGNLADDVEASLQNLETDLDQLPKPGKESRRAKKLRRRKARADRRKRHPIRRIIKWIFLALLISVLLISGYFVWKAVSTDCKMRGEKNCNIFKVIGDFSKKQRLKVDENGRTNVLIFGTSGESMSPDARDGALLTDSIMVISVNQDEHDAYMISLPRDLYVKHTCKKLLGTSAGKLNETYYCAYYDNGGDGEAGAAALRKTAGEIVGLDIQYSVHLNWAALRQGVDAVGGVDVVVESSDKRGIYDVATDFRIANGPAHLNGEQAIQFTTARNASGGYGLSGSNFAREQNQQKVLTALQQKVLRAETLTNLVAVNSLLDALGDNLRHTFQTSELQTLLDLAKNIKDGQMISLPLVKRDDNEKDLVTTGMIGNSSIVRPVKGLYDYSDIQEYVARSISADPIVREAAKIDVLNGSEEAGLAQKKADELKEAGYRINRTTNAPTTVSDKVKIYQLNADKTGTAAALETRFGIKITSGKLADYNTEADFVIIFGTASAE